MPIKLRSLTELQPTTIEPTPTTRRIKLRSLLEQPTPIAPIEPVEPTITKPEVKPLEERPGIERFAIGALQPFEKIGLAAEGRQMVAGVSEALQRAAKEKTDFDVALAKRLAEEKKQREEIYIREEEAKPGITPFKVGRTVGQIGKFAIPYGVAGGTIGRLAEPLAAKVGAVAGRFLPSTAAKVVEVLTVEGVKDLVIGTPIDLSEGLQAGLKGEELAKHMGERAIYNLIGNSVMLGGQKLLKSRALRRATPEQTDEIAGQIARQTELPEGTIRQILDDVAASKIEAPTAEAVPLLRDIPVGPLRPAIEPAPALRPTVEPTIPKIPEAPIGPLRPIAEPIIPKAPIVEPIVARPTVEPIIPRILEVPVKPELTFDIQASRGGIIDDITGEAGIQVKSRRIEPSTEYRQIITNANKPKIERAFQFYTTDFTRNLENTFKGDAPRVKRIILEPFDDAKAFKVREEQELLTKMKTEVVDKLGINKKSKLSSLTQQFGEKRVSFQELVQKVGQSDAEKIRTADTFFRTEYDRLLDEVNAIRFEVYGEKGLIPKREDYYRHFQDLDETFGGIKNLFETPAMIDPQLVGISEFARPNSKFLAFAQKRGLGRFKDDAVGGYLDYVQAATYAKHIDPQIPKLREFANDLRTNTEGGLNPFIQYLDDFTNDLAGKTNFLDRPVQKLIGRRSMKILNALNSRVKANTVLGNLSSTISQIGNVPNALATIQDPVALTKGMFHVMGSALNKGHKELYKQSNFITERYADRLIRSFDKRLIDQPKKLAAWLLEALDEMSTKYIWSSAYEQGLKQSDDPMRFADELTRKLVAGRSIGEVPLLQKSKLFQMIAPFTVEVSNALKVQKDLFKNKDLAGLGILYTSSFLLNNITEKITGNRILFDPIDVISEVSENPELSATESAGRMLGEIISAFPTGSNLAALYPEFGIRDPVTGKQIAPSREALFGEQDPTRFGTGLAVARGFQDPITRLILPFGGGQVRKTITGARDIGILPKINPKIALLEKDISTTESKLEKVTTRQEQTKLQNQLSQLRQDLEQEPKTTITPFPASFTKAGTRLRTPIEPTPIKKAKSLLFGTTSVSEVREFFKENAIPLGERQTQKFIDIVEKTKIDPNAFFEFVSANRSDKRKEIIRNALRDSNFTLEQKRVIFNDFYNFK